MVLYKIIKRHFRKSTAFIIVFVLCQILSVISACFVVSYAAAKTEYNNKFTEESRKIQIKTSEEGTGCLETIKLTSHMYANIIEKCYAWFTDNENKIKVNLSGYQENDKYISIGRYLYISDDAECLINPSMNTEFNDLVIGDYIEIQGNKYKIVGMFPYEYIEINTISQIDNLLLHEIEIVFKNDVSEVEMQNCINWLESSAYNIISHKKHYTNDLSLDLYEIILISLIFVITNLNFCSLYLYILDEDTEVLNTLRVIGVDYFKIVKWFVGEIAILCFVGFNCAVVAFQLIFAKILSKINPGLVFLLSTSDIILVAIIQIISITIIFVPLLNKKVLGENYAKNM